MTKLKRVQLKISIDTPEVPRGAPFEDRVRDVFDVSRNQVELEDLGHVVRISGKHGALRVSWSFVIEAWEADEPITTIGTAQAAAPKARGAK